MSMATATVDVTIEIEGEKYSILEIPPHSSSIVLKKRKELLGQRDFKTFVDDLGRVGGFVRVAYNGATAAGPEFADIQVKIQKTVFEVADLCDALAITVARFQDASGSILDDFQATCEYLLDKETDMAREIFKGISEVAGEMHKAAETLQKRFEDEKEKVDAVIDELTITAYQQRQCTTDSETEAGLCHAKAGLRSLCTVILQAAQIWRHMEIQCKELSTPKVAREFRMLETVENPNRLIKVVTLNPFKRGAVMFYARWVALNIVCSEYMDHIKATQKELYSYIREAPSYAQAKKDIGDLAKKFLV